MAEFKFGDRVINNRGHEGVVFHVYRKGKRVIVRVGYPGRPEHPGHVVGEDPWELKRAAIFPHTHTPAPAGTVPVRIAVAVDAYGNTAARIIGKNDDEDRAHEEVAEYLLDGQPGFCRVSVLTGDMPLPKSPAEVRGEVEG